MTTISAKVIEDSISPGGSRIVTYQLTYPRWLHPEVLTHRVMSRNASSSRAIPTSRLLKEIEANPAVPLHYGLNQPGMQAYEQIKDKGQRRAVRSLWMQALRASVKSCSEMVDLFSISKQFSNRVVEAHGHIHVVCTATDFDNFFALRCHPMAEPHFRALAWLMADLYYSPEQRPTPVPLGGWHLPYTLASERSDFSTDVLKRISAARCARVSYMNHEGKQPAPAEDDKLFARLLNGLVGEDPLEPAHLSPLEHQATPTADPNERSGNFRGWAQHRKEFARENMTFDYEAAVSRGWRDDALAILNEDP